MTPTKEQYGAYQDAFDWFNRRLFEGKLPACMLNFSRKAGSYGFYAPARWQNEGRTIAEISLNPDQLTRPAKEALSTLVHEMVHHWQQVYGRPSRTTYHNSEWAAKMMRIGLYPTSTGKPGGKTVGQRMTHYIVANGPFEAAFRDMPEKIRLPWNSGVSKAAPVVTVKSKVSYLCGICQARAWGKPGLNLWCGNCQKRFAELK